MTFTPVETTIGAVLIQLATTNFLWQRGQAIGFSSAVYSCVAGRSSSSVQIVCGMLLSSCFVQRFLPQFVPPPSFATGNVALLSIAGLLVGIGTRMGQGCTSGHMIAGLSRLRLRSLVATALFSTSAMATVLLTGTGQVLATASPNYAVEWNTSLLDNTVLRTLLTSATAAVYLVFPQISRRVSSPRTRSTIATAHGVLSGFLFGVGLHVAGMVSAAKTIGFLALPTPHYFDPSLALIMVVAVLPNIFIWRKIEQGKPLLAQDFQLASSTEIPVCLMLGAVLFGVGWGLVGVCPGPGLLGVVHHTGPALYWMGAFLSGQYVGQLAFQV